MPTLLQIFAASQIGLLTLSGRRAGPIVITVSLICLVMATFYFFSLFEGVTNAVLATADPNRVVVLSKGRPIEARSRLSAAQVEEILQAPGIARTPGGMLLADAQIVSGPSIGFAIGPGGFALRPELKLVEGRMFRSGSREIIAGIQQRDYFAQRLGGKITNANTEWTIVGFFSAGNLSDAGFYTDRETVQKARNRDFYNSVFLRLASPHSFEALKAALEKDGTLQVLREPDYIRAFLENGAAQARTLAYAIGFLLALGVFSATLHVMYAAVESRGEEIAILRALGFSGFAVGASVMLEAMLVSVLGALVGLALTWFWLDGTYFHNGLPFRVTPHLLLLAVEVGFALAFTGALLPSVRAARMTETDALRAS